jgi:hypothetical protein
MSVAEDHRDRAATGAEVDCSTVIRQESSSPPRELLGVRSRHEDSGIDAHADPAEAGGSGDPGERFSMDTTSDKVVNRSGPLGRRFEESGGLFLRSKNAGLG